MALKGILLGDNGDLLIENGLMAIGSSDDQNVSNLLSASKGEFKEFPILGAGIINYVKKQNTSLEGLKREITVSLQIDGYKAKSFNIDSSGNFSLDYELK